MKNPTFPPSTPLPHRVVAIDGPAASGKSSVARELARRLGFVYVNTGAMYRAVTWFALKRGIAVSDSEAVAALLDTGAIQFEVAGPETRRESAIRIDGTDPAPHLSDPDVNAGVPAVATISKVRQKLVARQQLYVNDNDLVMEGRDIGTAVFPKTPHKFYIDASPEVRAQRRAAQGHRDDLVARDRIDVSRAHSPLVTAPDAETIDSSNLTVEGVVEEILRHLERQGLPVPAEKKS